MLKVGNEHRRAITKWEAKRQHSVHVEVNSTIAVGLRSLAPLLVTLFPTLLRFLRSFSRKKRIRYIFSKSHLDEKYSIFATMLDKREKLQILRSVNSPNVRSFCDPLSHHLIKNYHSPSSWCARAPFLSIECTIMRTLTDLPRFSAFAGHLRVQRQDQVIVC